MIQGRRVLALITARGGDQRLPGKNLLPLGGRPMLAWSILAAQGSRYVDRLILSSEDRSIIACAREWGCEAPFVRPAELASDRASSAEVVLHALDALDEPFDLLALLQPTSPLRLSSDIDGCIEAAVRPGATGCVAVSPAAKSPYYYFSIAEDGRLCRLLDPRSSIPPPGDLPPLHIPNGACYVLDVAWFRESRSFHGPDIMGYVMPVERSVDVNTRIDLGLAEILMRDGRRNA